MRRSRTDLRGPRLLLLGIGWTLALLLAATASAQAPPAPGTPSLARYIPRQDLVLYVEFDGLDAHADAWHETAAYKFLNETGAGGMLKDLATQIAERALASSGPDRALTGAELIVLDEQIARDGIAFAINRKVGDPKAGSITLVLRGAGQGRSGALVRRLIEAAKPPQARFESVPRAGGRRLNVATPPRNATGPALAWWVEGDDLVLTIGAPEGTDAILETLDGQRPNAKDHPVRAALAREEDGFRPVGLAFLDATGLPPLPPEATTLGLDGIKRFDLRWGFRGDALMSIARLIAPAPRRGTLALFDQPTFDKESLPPLPADLTSFSVFSIKPEVMYDQVVALLRATGPDADPAIDAVSQAVRDATGQRLREDILAHLGPRMAFYVLPTQVRAPTNPLSGFVLGLVQVPKAVFVAEVDDPAAFGPVLDALVAAANRSFQAGTSTPGDEDNLLPPGARRSGRRQEAEPIPTAAFRPLGGETKGYTLVVPPGVFPLPAGLRPTVALGKKYVVVATTPEQAVEAVDLERRESRWSPNGRLAKDFERLPSGLTFLNVSDPRETYLPELIANLPGIVQTIASMQGSGPPIPRIGPRRFRGQNPSPFQVRVDPDQIPSADALRAHLFPATVLVAVDDEGISLVSREAFPALNPATLAPIALGMSVPSVQSSRTAARRSQSVNNLKQIGLAMHNFASANDRFPPAAIADKDGKPLLSWRVAILPFIEQQGLFNEFKLDEPWDSEHNKALIERMPSTYAHPTATTAEPGQTFYQVINGPGSLFENKEGSRLAEITDGTSNTIMVVEAKAPVIWTKPDDIPFDPDQSPLPALGGQFPGGFNVLFADGSVRFIRDTINETVLKAIITQNGGEVVSADSF